MNPQRSGTEARWYQPPVVWLGLAILLVSIAGCIAVIVAASRYPDEPVHTGSETVLKVPVSDPRESGS